MGKVSLRERILNEVFSMRCFGQLCDYSRLHIWNKIIAFVVFTMKMMKAFRDMTLTVFEQKQVALFGLNLEVDQSIR